MALLKSNVFEMWLSCIEGATFCPSFSFLDAPCPIVANYIQRSRELTYYSAKHESLRPARIVYVSTFRVASLGSFVALVDFKDRSPSLQLL